MNSQLSFVNRLTPPSASLRLKISYVRTPEQPPARDLNHGKSPPPDEVVNGLRRDTAQPSGLRDGNQLA
jgi:hypothetical protein